VSHELLAEARNERDAAIARAEVVERKLVALRASLRECQEGSFEARCKLSAAIDWKDTAERVAKEALVLIPHAPDCCYYVAQVNHSRGYRGSDPDDDECTCRIATLRAQIGAPPAPVSGRVR
jgi:hypothetical protein